ncbi:MAG: TIM barrel protein [Pseudomonadota bacterium]
MKQSFVVFPFLTDSLDAEGLIRAAADIGLQGIESSREDHWRIATDHGLSIAAAAGHLPVEVGLNDPANHDQIEAALRQKIEAAGTWNIEKLVCFAGNRYGPSDKDAAEFSAECLLRVAKVAESAGVTLVLELLNSKIDHPEFQGDHVDWGLEVCRLVDSRNVKLLFDIYHMQIMEGDLIRTIESYAEQIGHYHTAGNPGRGEIGSSQEINYSAVMHAIRNTGYSGYVGHEFVPKGDPLDALREAHAICRLDSSDPLPSS